MDDQEETNARFDKFIEDQREFNEKALNWFQRLDASVGELKGNVARQAAGLRVDEIAAGLGLRFMRTMPRDERVRLFFDRDTSDISAGDRQSFYGADIIIEASSPDGAPHWIAVEASYTADRRDTGRAFRNAELLTRFTGQPAHPAIASLRNDRDILDLIAEGRILWLELTTDDFTPE